MRRRMRALITASIAASMLMAGPATVSAVFREPLEWRACPEDAAIDCAWLEVPVDHDDPSSSSLQLPLRRTTATDPANRLGTLVTIAGGPGQRGTAWIVPGWHTALIHERFDVVSWDPRGTSADSLIDCIPVWDPFEGLDRTPDDDTERRALDARTAELAQHCRAEHGELLPYIGTYETALDLELLRQALREERLSILGTSYGSEVALAYATRFPHRVGAVVLDGYSDPNLSAADGVIEQARSFERALDALLQDCASEPTCPLRANGTPGATLGSLLSDLDREPIRTDDPASVLTQSDAYEAIAGGLLRDDAGRDLLLRALAAAADGDGTSLLRLAQEVRRSYEASGLTMGTFAAIECADDGPYWERLSPTEVEALAMRVQETAPRLGAWLWTPPSDPGLPPMGLCAMHPFYDLGRPTGFDAAGAGPVLVLTTTGDPTTPASAAARSADDLIDATVLTLESDGHLAYHSALLEPDRIAHACVLGAVEAYLIEGRTPPTGMTCGS